MKTNLMIGVMGLGFLLALFLWTRKNPKQSYQELTDPRKGEAARDVAAIWGWFNSLWED